MDLVTILATAAGEAEHHSETPFFLIGGALAAFGVIVGVLGIVRPNWGGGAMNAVMGIGALLTAGTMVAIVAVS
jgi:hypothetical protein